MSLQQRYHILSPIAAGGMAEVYRGESAGIEGFRKKVAIKRVLPKLSANHEFIDMFLDEARLCAYLNHSKCVQVFDIGQGGGSHFIVMEFVDGADLKQVMDHLGEKKQSLPVEVSCLIALQICEGLAYAHAACDHAGEPLNIVHRDVSPQNVLITRYGEIKLVDFGLARASSHLTEEDEDIVKGKFGYLAPEIAGGHGVDHRVDIFATGILLWEMLAGRRLFRGTTDLETFKQVRAAKVPDLRRERDDVSDAVMAVVLKALAKDRDSRYQTANAMARDLGVLLTRLAKPVTYQEVAQYVRAAADARQHERELSGRGNLLGDLILEELHQFSDSEEVQVQASLMPAAPSEEATHFVDPTAWDLGDDEWGDLLDAPAAAATAPNRPKLDAPRPPPRRRRSTRAPAGQRSIAAQRAEQLKARQGRSLRPAPPTQAAVPTASRLAADPSLPAPSAPRGLKVPAPEDSALTEGASGREAGGAWWKRWFQD